MPGVAAGLVIGRKFQLGNIPEGLVIPTIPTAKGLNCPSLAVFNPLGVGTDFLVNHGVHSGTNVPSLHPWLFTLVPSEDHWTGIEIRHRIYEQQYLDENA